MDLWLDLVIALLRSFLRRLKILTIHQNALKVHHVLSFVPLGGDLVLGAVELSLVVLVRQCLLIAILTQVFVDRCRGEGCLGLKRSVLLARADKSTLLRSRPGIQHLLHYLLLGHLFEVD